MARKPTAQDLDSFERQLRTMLAIVNGDIQTLENEALGDGAQVLSKNAEDGGDAYSQEFSLELLERDENTLFEIMEALERIKGGKYGRCEGCEKWIRKERLRAVPHARNCIECQRQMETDRF